MCTATSLLTQRKVESTDEFRSDCSTNSVLVQVARFRLQEWRAYRRKEVTEKDRNQGASVQLPSDSMNATLRP